MTPKRRKMISGSLAYLGWQFFPIIPAVCQRSKNLAKIATRQDEPISPEDEVYLALELDDLRDSLRAILALRDQLQRRAQAYLMAVAVSLSFAIGASAMLVQAGEVETLKSVPFVSRLVVAMIVLNFITSALCSLLVLGPSNIYDTWLRSKIPNKIDQRKANAIRFIHLNESYSMAYSLQLRGAYNALRNGVILLGVWLVVMLTCPNLFAS